MIWYVLFFAVGGFWIFKGLYLIAWSLLTMLRHLIFGVGEDYRD